MFDHTPAPWKHEFGIIYITLENGCRKVIARTSHNGARLIAAAPEMLECLIWELKANVKRFGLEKTKLLNMCYVLEKATGKQIEQILKEYQNG